MAEAAAGPGTRSPAAGPPFPADPARAARLAELESAVGPAARRRIRAALDAPGRGPLDGAVLTSDAVTELVADFGLASPDELAILALPLARELARPPISGYRVGAVGVCQDAAGTTLVLGGNLEFPGTDLGTTVHGEGFVSLRARRRGARLATLVLTAAHPCAFCRQLLAESSAAAQLRIIDPAGHDLPLPALYPWPFLPEALGRPGDEPGHAGGFILQGPFEPLPDAVSSVLEVAARQAYAPYSGAPSAVAVRLADGRVHAAGGFESVSFNPSVPALAAAIVEVVAGGGEPGSIEAAWLVRTPDGPIDPVPGARQLLAAVAPGAALVILDGARGG